MVVCVRKRRWGREESIAIRTRVAGGVLLCVETESRRVVKMLKCYETWREARTNQSIHRVLVSIWFDVEIGVILR